jgi:hypothetical protein
MENKNCNANSLVLKNEIFSGLETSSLVSNSGNISQNNHPNQGKSMNKENKTIETEETGKRHRENIRDILENVVLDLDSKGIPITEDQDGNLILIEGHPIPAFKFFGKDSEVESKNAYEGKKAFLEYRVKCAEYDLQEHIESKNPKAKALKTKTNLLARLKRVEQEIAELESK